MYRVMIVDDEIYLTVLISKLVKWEDFDMQVDSVLYDGESAYRLASSEHFDLIILDVRMPGIDGISLMEKLREADKATKFVVISGHKSFDYARGALQNDAEDYLLKPIIRADLEQILGKVRAKLDAEKDNAALIQKISEDCSRVNSMMRRNAMDKLLLSPTAKAIEELRTRFGVELAKPCFLPLIVTLDYLHESQDTGNCEVLLSRIGEYLYDDHRSTELGCLSTIRGNSLIMLLNYDGRISIQDEIARLERLMTGLLNRFENITSTICIGREITNCEALPQSFAIAEDCRQARIALGTGRIIRPENLRSNDAMVNAIYEEYASGIAEAIRSFNSDSLCGYSREMLLRGDALRIEDSLIYRKLSERLLHGIHDYLTHTELCGDTYKAFTATLSEQLDWACSVYMFIRRIEAFIRERLDAYGKTVQNGENPAIRVAKIFISEHYAEDISLARIASVVNLSQIYFSMLFKREVGMNFLEYLNRFRIRRAKQFLKDIKYNINEISSLCGFENPRYFSQLFKKAVGITPSEYRKRHMNEGSL